MSNALLLSLGHNSSAIYTNGTSNIGYETERLDRVKSSSGSPIKAIHEIEKHSGVKLGTPVFVTHWYDSFEKKIPESKHTIGLERYVSDKNSKIITHTKNFTHHDAHAWSVYSFWFYYASRHHTSKPLAEDYHIIVADGFGNYQEVISIYKLIGNRGPELIDRIYGYENSMGLMYQYATDFVGMKMHQDEYKFLGYESNVKIFTSTQIKKIQDFVDDVYPKVTKNRGLITLKEDDNLLNLRDLERVRIFWKIHFTKLLRILKIKESNGPESRVAVGFFIQSLLEKRFYFLLKDYDIKNLLVAGGVFYNVKLNNFLLQSVPGYFSAVPLAGDQGAAIGFYQKYVGQFNWSTLAIGERGFYKQDIKYLHNPEEDNIHIVHDEEQVLDLLFTKITNNEICNFVTNKMEYGPRALGHTSSLFLPTEANASLNNTLNLRNNIMPFAPMMSTHHMSSKFNKDHYSRVIGSDQFMILAYDYIDKPRPENAGVYHQYPLISNWSGRPQIITQENNSLLHKLFFNLMAYNQIGMLTNTSYNYHGEPIVFSIMDILATHQKQMSNAKKYNTKVNLIIYKIKES